MSNSQDARFISQYGPWALVAGASEGLGAAFAVELARRGLNVFLLARRAELLLPLAARLESEFKIQARTAAIDLSDPALADKAVAATKGLEIGLLVYNAAHSNVGPFLATPLSKQLLTIDVNCRGPLILSHVYGTEMASRKRGGILLMTSIAGSQGSPFIATYAASKAFNLVLGESLWDELRTRGVDVLACRAGATRTPNYEDTKPTTDQAPVMEPEAVVLQALNALGRGPSVVTGGFNKMATFFLGRLFPRRAAIRTMGRAMRKMYGFPE